MNYVGPAAGATLGFIQGGVPGAVVGFKAGQYFTKRKQSEMANSRSRSVPRTPRRRSRSVSRGRVRSRTPARLASSSASSVSSRRSAMSVDGSSVSTRSKATSGGGVSSRMASVKRIGTKKVGFKRAKVVKVSKTLRAQVKKIEEGATYRGTYIATYYGYIAHDITARGTFGVGDQIDLINIQGGFNGITYWSRPLSSVTGTTSGRDFNFFSYPEIMNAASILWNQKPVSIDYYQQVGNFTSQYSAVGVPSARSAGVKLTVKSSWVDFELVNNTQRCREVVINICTPKLKFPDSLPLRSYVNAINNMISTNNLVVASTNGALTSAANNGLHPKMLSDFNSEWSYEAVKFCIEAGQSVKYKLQGPSNAVYDWSKVYPGGDDKSRSFVKGMGRYVFITYENDLLTTTTNKVGTVFPSAPNPSGLIGIRYTRHINLSCPENAGFIKQTAADGIPQQLNLKKNFLAVANFSEAYDPAVDTYTRIDEENPVVVESGPQ